MKMCTRCGVLQDLSEFSPNVGAKDGLQSNCKACGRAAKKARRLTLLGRTDEQVRAAFDAAPDELKCGTCGAIKPKAEFPRDRGRTIPLAQNCKPCATDRALAYRQANPEKVAAARRAAHLRDPLKRREHQLKKNFGLTRAEYEAMHAAQGGVCAICGRAETSKANHGRSVKELAVDHDHVTGEVRALLCHNCNKGIGHLQDDPAVVQAAADYLTKYKEMADHG